MIKDNEEQLNQQPYDDSKEIVTIDYYDRINRKWIKVDVTKEVARFMKADTQQRRRKQNQYDFYNKSYDKIFDEDKHPENMKYLLDETQSPEYIMEQKEKLLIENAKKEEQRTMIENSLNVLNDTQLEVIEKTFYENKSENDIAEELGISQQAVSGRLIRAEKNIKNHIKDTEN